MQIPLGSIQTGSPPVLVMVSSFSRFITAVMLPSRTTSNLLSGMWQLISTQLEAVPRRLIWYNEADIGRGNYFAAGVSAFTGMLATSRADCRRSSQNCAFTGSSSVTPWNQSSSEAGL